MVFFNTSLKVLVNIDYVIVGYVDEESYCFSLVGELIGKMEDNNIVYDAKIEHEICPFYIPKTARLPYFFKHKYDLSFVLM